MAVVGEKNKEGEGLPDAEELTGGATEVQRAPSPRTPSGRRAPSSGSGVRPIAGVVLKTNDVLCDRFQIVKFLARGGMGDVFEAFDLELGEPVALKTIRPETAAAEGALDRFRREILLSHRVTHPNVCRIYDLFHHRVRADADDEITFVTMELLRGDTLSARLRKGPFTTDEALPVVRQMVQALAAAHRAGIVHRDFKSSNVILVPSDETDGGMRAVVTDFGIARSVAAGTGFDDSLTADGIVLGTPAYMAPEQVEGRPLTAAADIYSLGIVLYEMVTGKRPFTGDNQLSTAVQRLKSAPPPPRLHKPDLDARWEETILRCLEREPADRFPSVGQVTRSLEGLTVAASQPSIPAVPEARKSGLFLIVAAGALLPIAAVVLLMAKGREKPAILPPVPAAPVPTSFKSTQVTSSTGLDVYPSFSPDGTAVAYGSDRGGRFEVYVRPFGGQETQVTSDGQQNLQPAFSPDGSRIAYLSKSRGGIWVIPVSGGTPTQLTETGSRPAWSPDGTLVVYQSDPLVDPASTNVAAQPPSTLWTVDTKEGRPRQLTKAGTPKGGHGAPSFSPDGKRLFFVAGEMRSAAIWTMAADGSGLAKVVGDQPYCYDPVLSPDGRWLHYCAISKDRIYGLYRIPVDAQGKPAGKSVELAIGGLGPFRHLTLARDGRRLAYATVAVNSNLWGLPVTAAGEPAGESRPLTAETGRNARPVFSADGSRLAFNRWRLGVTETVWMMDVNGRDVQELTGFAKSGTYAPTFFPDGRQVAYFTSKDGKKAFWRLDLATKAQTLLLDLPDSADFTRLSPDGKHVAFNAQKGGGLTTVFIADLSGGAPKVLTEDNATISFPCWSPDGRVLAVDWKRGEDTQVATLPMEGGVPEALTSERGHSWAHSFSPDGEKVAFAGHRNGLWNVYWVSRTTKEQRQLTKLSRPNVYVRYPAWSPRGDQIVYELGESTGNVWMLEGQTPK